MTESVHRGAADVPTALVGAPTPAPTESPLRRVSLIGDLQRAPIDPPANADASPLGPAGPNVSLAVVAPAVQLGTPPTAQRSAVAPQSPIGPRARPRSATEAQGVSAEPRLAFVPPPAAEQGTAPDDLLAPVQLQPSDSDGPAAKSPPAVFAPLVGDRHVARTLGAWSADTSGQQPARAGVKPELPRQYPVQRSVLPSTNPGERMGDTGRGGRADTETPLSGYVDPGEIAVGSGLARRDADGSVVFDVSAAPMKPSPGSFPAPHGQDLPGWATVATAPVMQRQEAAEPAESASPPLDIGPGSRSRAVEPVATAAPVAGAPSPAAGATGQPLDELARQLLGPLTARLKAELRLDRERAGLLTDLRL